MEFELGDVVVIKSWGGLGKIVRKFEVSLSDGQGHHSTAWRYHVRIEGKDYRVPGLDLKFFSVLEE